MSKPITSGDLVRLLKQRYRDKWYFVGEVGCGSAKMDAGQGNGRLDGWAMRPAWANPAYLGFEIKVTRQDFLRDDKWPQYLGACNQFYFVTPQGLVTKEEVPEAAGLLEASTNCKVLKMVKKAPHREVNYGQLFNVLKARLMSQFYDTFSTHSADSDDERLRMMEAEEWGKIRGDRIAALLHQKQVKLEEREASVRRLEENCAPVREFASRFGIHIDKWRRPSSEEVRLRWLQANGHLAPPEIGQTALQLEQTASTARFLAERLRKFVGDADAAVLENENEEKT